MRCKDTINNFQVPISPELKIRYQRTNIELFYREKVTKKLIKEDLNGKFRKQISKFKSVTNEVKLIKPEHEVPISDEEKLIKKSSIYDHRTATLLLQKILRTTPIFEDTAFLSDAKFSVLHLNKFIDISIENSTIIQAQFGIQVRKNIKTNPIQFLGIILKLVGLKCTKPKKVTRKRISTYYYELDSIKLNRILDIVNRQTDERYTKEMDIRYRSKWTYMNEQHSFKYSFEQEKWLCPGFGDSGEPMKRNKNFKFNDWATTHNLGG